MAVWVDGLTHKQRENVLQRTEKRLKQRIINVHEIHPSHLPFRIFIPFIIVNNLAKKIKGFSEISAFFQEK